MKKGDIVYHVTNGNQKLVVYEEGAERVKCSWIDNSGIYHYDSFLIFELILTQ